MGLVYLATRVSDGALVAVKCFHRHMAQDEVLRGRFDRESRALAALEHPNIVRHLDGGVQEVEGQAG